MTFTQERLEQFINKPLEHGLTRGEQMEMARQMLVSMEREPVAWLHYSVNGAPNFNTNKPRPRKGNSDAIALYFAPPAPVVPEEMYWQDAPVEGSTRAAAYATGWNACRAAMLQGAEPRQAVRSEHAEWSQSTFGDVGPVGPLKHLSKEALEASAEPGDLSEWADMQFLLWDAQRRAGITDEQITLAMIEKLAINKARDWPEPKDGEPRLHIKKAPQQEDPQIKK